jgi:hypothetical protein
MFFLNFNGSSILKEKYGNSPLKALLQVKFNRWMHRLESWRMLQYQSELVELLQLKHTCAH